MKTGALFLPYWTRGFISKRSVKIVHWDLGRDEERFRHLFLNEEHIDNKI